VRRRKPKLHDNHERWLISYADFITLLFAFFVVLFASSKVDRGKVQSFAANFESLMNPAAAGAMAGLGGPLPPEGEETGLALHQALTMAEMRPSLERLESDLLPEIRQGKLELSLHPRGIVMSLRQSAFFESGQAELQPESLEIMAKVAQALAEIPGEIRLEGHTDDRPIHNERFPSNWHLSTARAINVLKLLAQRYGIALQRLAAAGYGAQRPLVPNDTPEDRAKNRRVDVVILTKDAAAMEPGKKQKPSPWGSRGEGS